MRWTTSASSPPYANTAPTVNTCSRGARYAARFARHDPRALAPSSCAGRTVTSSAATGAAHASAPASTRVVSRQPRPSTSAPVASVKIGPENPAATVNTPIARARTGAANACWIATYAGS